jgi:hypothetical protein
MSALRPLSGAHRTSTERIIRSSIRAARRTCGDDNSLLGALLPVDLLIKLGDPPARALAVSERLSASVRFRAVTGRPSRQLPRLGCAKGSHMHSSNLQLYSTTSSASEISLSVTASPSALAIFALIASSNFVGCATGRPARFQTFATQSALNRRANRADECPLLGAHRKTCARSELFRVCPTRTSLP